MAIIPLTKLSEFETRVAEKIPNVTATDLSTLQKTANLGQAISEYSRLRPLEKIDEKAGDGNYEYALPSDWVVNFSIFRKIEYPAGTSQDPNDDLIEPEKYEVYKTSSTSKLRFFDITPTSGKTIRRTYTIKHLVDVTSSTIFLNDGDAVCALAAAFCCFDCARFYAQDSSSYISADAVDRRGKSSKYLEAGRGLVKEYATHMGLGEETVTAAVGVKNLDFEYPWGQDFITHPADWR